MSWPIFWLNEEHVTVFTFRLHYKHFSKFANRKDEDLSYPKKSKNMRPHSNSIENATPFNPVVKMRPHPWLAA